MLHEITRPNFEGCFTATATAEQQQQLLCSSVLSCVHHIKIQASTLLLLLLKIISFCCCCFCCCFFLSFFLHCSLLLFVVIVLFRQLTRIPAKMTRRFFVWFILSLFFSSSSLFIAPSLLHHCSQLTIFHSIRHFTLKCFVYSR